MSETRKVRVILVEDHIAFRQALAFLLGREPDLEVVAQAGSLAQAREVLVDGHIDVAVVDLSLPDGDGRDLIGELRRRHSGISVVVLSATIVPGLCGRHLRLRERRQAGRLRESGPGGPRLGQEGGQQQKDARREQDPKKGPLPLCVL